MDPTICYKIKKKFSISDFEFLFKTIMLEKFLNHQIFLKILKHTLYLLAQMIKEINFILRKEQENYLK